MELQKENCGNSHASFLDLEISIVDNQFCTKLFDKRDTFPFSIVRMPYKCSNIPSAIFYSSFGAEILRINRASTIKDDFIFSAKSLLIRVTKQGADKAQLVNVIKRFYGRHRSEFMDVAESSSEFVYSIFS